MATLTSLTNPPEPFWNRRTAGFAALGLVCYAVSRLLQDLDSNEVLILIGIVRMAPAAIAAGIRRAWPALFATPYPYDLALTLHSKLGFWLPVDLAMQSADPTYFLIFMGTILFISIPVTGVLIARAVTRPVTEPLRKLGGWLLAITAGAVLLSFPPWSLLVMRNVAEPIALAGFSAILGSGAGNAVKRNYANNSVPRVP